MRTIEIFNGTKRFSARPCSRGGGIRKLAVVNAFCYGTTIAAKFFTIRGYTAAIGSSRT